jgi:hypothetical protein
MINNYRFSYDVDPRIGNFMIYRFIKEHGLRDIDVLNKIILMNWFDKQVFINHLNEDILSYMRSIYFRQPI